MALEEDANNAEAETTTDNQNSPTRDQNAEDSDEEDECRVCRGPAEEGRPLFAPCKCSGSIGLVHQDCLMSWLAVTRGDGRCELCKTKFRFDPQYADNAPNRLPAHEVLLGLSSRAIARWLPLALRFLVAASLWLMVAPLITVYLYHGWMHRPSSIMTRWKRELFTADIVSGAVVAAVIIISFLSLMSFADFLRVHWQQPPPRRGEENDDQRRNDVANGFAEDNNDNNNEVGIDDAIVNLLRTVNLARQQDAEEEAHEDDSREKNTKKANGNAAGDSGTNVNDQTCEPTDEARGGVQAPENLIEREINNVDEQALIDEGDMNGLHRNDHGQHPHQGRGDEAPREELDQQPVQARPLAEGPLDIMDPMNQDGGGEVDADNDDLPPLLFPGRDEGNNGDDEDDDVDDEDLNADDGNHRDEIPPMMGRNNDDRLERPFDPMDPVLQDDQVELEINVALDELLGLRGPLSTLIRNLLWLLAFNATYLGIFAFVPRTVGSTIYSGIFNTTACSSLVRKLPYVYSENEEETTITSMVSGLNVESARLNTSFRLPDLAMVTLGYLSIAMIIVLVRYGWIFSHHIRNRFNLDGTNAAEEGEPAQGNRGRRELEVDRIHFGGLDDRDAMEPPEAAGSVAVSVALDATVAVVKVGILLFLKMFLLPLLLGLWLDSSTMSLFGNELSERVIYAGSDLFSFILLHWVAGITFMLLVTVFLLQLREVAHPDLLSRLIRPQEPQPDLLGNLMHESVSTHMKRMFLSLAIYAPLLTILVSVPVKLFVASGLGKSIPFFRVHFWHVVMPQMQIPLELIVFHLTMLALLERYKNSIGELQHHWLVFMCRRMGLTDHILPQSIEKFELIGTKRIFLPKVESRVEQIDPYWYELAKKEKDIDDFILSNIEPSGNHTFADGESKANGEKVLSRSINFIRLPQHPSEDTSDLSSTANNQNLLPTKIGRFRLNLGDSSVIEVWREVPGREIPRPPEGWDDLGAGGAFVQGRWAWGKERKSLIEGSVAQRTPFRASENRRRPVRLMLKVASLLFFSWVAITVTVCGIVSAPLAVGRALFYLFRVPQEYIHDPLAFCIGGCLFFPMTSIAFAAFNSERADSTLPSRFTRWASRMHLPPRRKLVLFLQSLALWFAVAPISLGVAYELVAVKSARWYAGEENLWDIKSMWLCWMVGGVVLNSWAFLAYFSVFTREFWANIGNGILEPPLDDNDRAVDQARGRQNGRDAPAANGEPRPGRAGGVRGWQGKEGRAAQCFNAWKAVLFEWEWDAVDKVVLLEDFALPIAKHAFIVLVASSLSYLVIFVVTGAFIQSEGAPIEFPGLGQVDAGFLRLVAFRICMTVHVLLQLCLAFRAPLESWFQAAHKVARDDRYLIGEVLMNFVPEDES